MILKFTAACLIVLAILSLLKFVQDSPIRTWKAVFLIGIPLSVIVCYWVTCAFPPPPPPAPKSEKVSAYKAELERTFRRIEGVKDAKINGQTIEIEFGQDQPIEKLKEIAHQTGGTAAHFLATSKTNRIIIYMRVRGSDRYRMEYDTSAGVVSEKTY